MKKTVFITGASSGFGKETVRLFHEKGWNVVATMRSPSEAFAELDGVLVERLDVTEEASIGAAMAAAMGTFGRIAVTRAVLPGMRAQRSGVIINVSSIGGRITFPFSTLYHATKFAVEGLTESLQYELNPLGITKASVRTPFFLSKLTTDKGFHNFSYQSKSSRINP
jgi:NAD(P)-dependent dehydrogenase (short-subunit alcohol dehydrogenase family)